jgi:hypothetical protein
MAMQEKALSANIFSEEADEPQRSGGTDGPEGRQAEGSERVCAPGPGGEAPDTINGRQESLEGKDSGKNEKGGFVYFIETAEGEFVKIGYSRLVFSRLSQLGTLRPTNFNFRLLGCIPGTLQTEKWLHDKFAADRDAGEWFRASISLRAFIADVGLIAPLISACQGVPVEQGDIEFPPEIKLGKIVKVDVTEIGRLGGLATAANRDADERSEAARRAVQARWKAYYADHPEKRPYARTGASRKKNQKRRATA